MQSIPRSTILGYLSQYCFTSLCYQSEESERSRNILFFCQKLIKNSSVDLTDKEKEAIVRRSIFELDNKVVALNYLAEECKKQANKVVLIKENNKKKNIYDYKPYQIFLTLCESYLNTVHSISDSIKAIDKLFKKDFAKKIKQEEWFKIDMDLRNVFHHNESPLLNIEEKEMLFSFERLPERPKFLNEAMRNPSGKFEFIFDYNDLSNDMLSFLQKWAKEYVDLISDEEIVETIVGYHKDGEQKIKRITLKQIKSKSVL